MIELVDMIELVLSKNQPTETIWRHDSCTHNWWLYLCEQAVSSAYCEANRDRFSESNRAYHEANREKHREQMNAYRRNNLARPAKASPQERLSEAYARLVAQGEPVTRARLRQEARVSTDAARTFLGEKQARIRRAETK